MNFKEFIAIDDNTDIELVDTEYGIEANFKVDGSPYNVQLEKVMRNFAGMEIMAYNVEFHSGQHFMGLTNKGNAPRVYNKLAQVIDKAIKSEDIKALTFFGAGYRQDMVYYQLYEKYLKKHFTRVAGNLYVRNDVIDSYKDKPEVWQRIQQGIGDTNKLMQQSQSKWKEQRDKERSMTAKLNALKGYIAKADGVAYYIKGPQSTHRGLALMVVDEYGNDFPINVNHYSGEVKPFTQSELTFYADHINKLKAKFPDAKVYTV